MNNQNNNKSILSKHLAYLPQQTITGRIPSASSRIPTAPPMRRNFMTHSPYPYDDSSSSNPYLHRLQQEQMFLQQQQRYATVAQSQLRQVGTLARNKRELLGLTEQDLANITGLLVMDITQFEMGSPMTTLEKTLRIFSALQLNINIH